MNYILIGVVVFLFLKAGWEKFSGTIEKGSELTNGLSFNLDLNQTVPGKLINSVLGEGWANWIIWLIIILIILMVIRNFLPNSVGRGISFPKISLTPIIVFAMIVGGYIYVSMKVDERNRPLDNVKVDLTKIEYKMGHLKGESLTVKMNLNSVAHVVLRRALSNEPGEGDLWLCAEIANKESYKKVIMFEVVNGLGTFDYYIAVTADSQKYLLSEYNTTVVSVVFTPIRSLFNPCPYLLMN